MGLTRCFSDLILSVDVEKVQDEAIRAKIRKYGHQGVGEIVVRRCIQPPLGSLGNSS